MSIHSPMQPIKQGSVITLVCTLTKKRQHICTPRKIQKKKNRPRVCSLTSFRAEKLVLLRFRDGVILGLQWTKK